MSIEAKEIIFFLLKEIRKETILTPNRTNTEKEALKQLEKMHYPTSDSVVESSSLKAMKHFNYSIEKRVDISGEKIREFEENFGKKADKILKILKSEKFIVDYQPIYDKKSGYYYGITLAENFEVRYKKYKSDLEAEIRDTKELENLLGGKELNSRRNRNYGGIECMEENKRCFLREGKDRVEIGGIGTRKCKLLKCLLNSPAKIIDVVLGDIEIPRDRENPMLWNAYLGGSRKESIIRGTGKEIQRAINNAENKIKTHLIFHVKDKKVWIELD